LVHEVVIEESLLIFWLLCHEKPGLPSGPPVRSTIQITLSGETTDGQIFEGSDNIVLKGKKILEN